MVQEGAFAKHEQKEGHPQINVQALATFAALDELDVLVSDAALPAAAARAVRGAVGRLILG